MKIKMMFQVVIVFYTVLIALAVNEIYSLKINNTKIDEIREVRSNILAKSDMTQYSDKDVSLLAKTKVDINTLGKNVNDNITFMYTIMFMVILSTLLTYIAVRKKILEPVDKMRQTILDYDAGNDVKEFESNNDEIGLMIKEFFAMKKMLDDDYNELGKLSFIDSLTGAFNRDAFFEIAEKQYKLATRNEKPFSIIIFDIDHFKKVNNDFGHALGDEVLKDLVSNVTHQIRASDLFARFGGEEFILMLPDTDQVGAISLARKIRLYIEINPFKNANSTIPITISLGVSTLKEVSTLHDLIHKASDALSHAKETGRNKVEVN